MGGGGRGGRGRARTQRRHFSEKRENVWNRPKSDPSNTNDDSNGHNSDSGPWLPFATQNPAFDEYYKEQGIVSPEEWYTFIEYLRKPLPAAFRINSSSQFWMDIQSQLENDFAKSLQAEFIGGDEAQALRPLAWYPENLAWHSNFSRMQLRKNQALERFHEFLKLENEIGNITRQEAVSMVPPLFLDVHPGHFVLDMCAAPGSKTFQLLEIIHRSIKPGSLPEGLVVANDLDVQRCNLLIHQTKRMCTANLVVTNHEAQQFPSCRLNKSFLNEPEMGKQSGLNQLIFDRILCDVPCSGDGTLRKAPDIWRKWTTGMGNGIHRLQVLIAMRGISLLKVGGRMVYSTCSMNPVENEAVVAEILRKCGGCIELLDVSSELPQLVRRPGLKKWKVRDRGTWLASYNDVPASRRAAITPSMFPSGRKSVDPTGHSVALQLEHQNEHALGSGEQSFQSDVPVTLADDLEKEVSDFPLEFCMRIVPHDQNGGAFFIAVFQKVASLPGAALEKQNACREKSFESDRQTDEAQNMLLEDMYTSEDCAENGSNEIFSKASLEPHVPGAVSEAADCIDVCGGQDSKETEAPGNEDVDGRKAGSKRKLQMQGKWKGVDPVVFFEDEEVINIRTFYGIDESFPLRGHLVTRNSETNRVKRIYYISKSVKELLELNFKVGQQLKITSIGLKMFERQTSREGTSAPCLFRISSEGLPLILPYLTKQIIDVPAVDFKHLLQYKSVRFSDFVDAEFGENVSKLMPGCCVVVLRKDDQDSSKPNLVRESPIAIGCWKGKATLSVMVTAIDCQELLERLLLRMESKKESSAVKRTSSEDGNEGINNNELTEDVDDIRLMAK